MDLWSNVSYLFDNLIKTDFQKSHSLHGVQLPRKVCVCGGWGWERETESAKDNKMNDGGRVQHEIRLSAECCSANAELTGPVTFCNISIHC